MIIRSAFGYDVDKVSDENGLSCDDESLTVQADAEEADINFIVRRMGLTGTLPVHSMPPLDVQFAEALTFKDAQNLLVAAQQAFMEQPAEVRSRFNHDPGYFVSFVSDPANLEEVRQLGLAPPAPVVEESVPFDVRVVPALPPDAP